MSQMSPLDLLKRARERLEIDWIQTAYFDYDSQPDPAFCLVGAIVLEDDVYFRGNVILECPGIQSEAKITALGMLYEELCKDGWMLLKASVPPKPREVKNLLVLWNNYSGRAYNEVLDLLDRVISRCEVQRVYSFSDT